MFRWFVLVVFVATLGISAWHRRRARQMSGAISRRQESRGLIVGRIVVALPLFSGVIVYVANPRAMAWASLPIPEWLRWVGVALGVLVVPAVHWVLANLGANVSETVLVKPQHRLVTSGPYRWVRHPLYTVGLTLFVSIGLMAANWFILLWAVAAALGIRLVVIPREEAELEARFGEDYRRYRRSTSALVPSLSGILAQRRAG